MLRVGLTGGIASGKTTVSDALREHGAVVIDADVLAREVVEPGTPGLAAVVERFGTEILTADGHLERAALGRLVFADDQARRDLEAIIHPAVRARAAQLEAAAAPDAVVVHVIPLLVETGQHDDFDVLVVVDAEPDHQLDRLQQRNSLDFEAAQARIAAQAERHERLAVADIILDNTTDREHLGQQIERLWADLRARATVG
ncbi:MAG: dephospho-CoA kinase [Microlunatus sp.]